MKHINLTKPNKYGLVKVMVTQESSNFGDQILTLKQLSSCGSHYVIMAITSRQEGDWMDLKQMKQWHAHASKLASCAHT